MVIGNGLVATAFREKYGSVNDVVIFAAGVSNSKTQSQNEFDREKNLLEDTIAQFPDAHLVYFSTCSVEDPSLASSLYVLHKLYIENYLKEHVNSYSVFRVSNLVGKTINPNTLVNYFFNKIKTGSFFELWTKAERNLIDIEDVFNIIDILLQTGERPYGLLNIANKINTTSVEIVAEIEKHLNLRANYELKDLGAKYEIILQPQVLKAIDKLNCSFDETYFGKLLKKYY